MTILTELKTPSFPDLPRSRTWPAEGESPAQGEWTYQDYRRLPDDGWRYEVIRGRLHMTPAPRPKHQKAVGRLHLTISRFVEERGLGDVYLSPIDVLLPGLASPVQPDLLFLREDRLSIVTDEAIEGAPDLVIEVLSPSNWFTDRRDKFEVYAQAGVTEYWIVDTDQRSIEIFALRGRTYDLVDQRGAGETVRSRVLNGLEVSIDQVLP